MPYTLLKIFTRIAIRVFFRRIHFRNIDRIPGNIPVILCTNHQNAFLDALVLVVFIKRATYFLPRGDVFNSPFRRWFFNLVQMIPIYRIEEGADLLHKNEETFQKCFDVLKKKNILHIFPEGICIQERRLRNLRKGAARIALGAEEANNFNLDSAIVCAGINYSKPYKFRSDLFINYSNPVKVLQFREIYLENKALGINAFNDHVAKVLKRLMVHVEDKSTDQLVEKIEVLYKSQLMSEFIMSSKNPGHDFLISKGIARAVNYFHKYEPEWVLELKEKINQYFQELKKLNIKDYLIKKRTWDSLSRQKVGKGSGTRDFSTSFLSFLKIFILLLLGFPFHLLGLMNNYLPCKIPQLIANKVIKRIEYYSSVVLLVGIFSFILYYPVMILLVSLIFKSFWISLIYAIAMPLSGYYSLSYMDQYSRIRDKWIDMSLLRKRKENIGELINKRTEIIKELEKGKREYMEEGMKRF
ncbi:MAG: 1-acyl-sn-glycerol-3-phosphate acyltransferase [Bacteroidota bacterium]